jgi:hypothetical protein
MDGIFPTPRCSLYRTRWPDESNVMVARVCAAARVGNTADTTVAPEPPVRATMHSPPESEGATSGANARIAASPLRGLNESLIDTRLTVDVAVLVLGVAGAGGCGAREAHAATIPAPMLHVSINTGALMAFASYGLAGSTRGRLNSAPVSSP